MLDRWEALARIAHALNEMTEEEFREFVARLKDTGIFDVSASS